MIPKVPAMNKLIFPIGLGAMAFSIKNRPSYKEAIDVIHHFIGLGGNFIDTANIYSFTSRHIGENEKLIADALKKRKFSEDIIVSTKGGGTRPNEGWGLGSGAPKQLRAACEKSLQDLDVDAIDLYYLHGVDPKIPIKESLGELDCLKKEGKIKHIGISNVTKEQLKQAMEVTKITALQNRCNPFCKADIESGLISDCRENDIIYVAYCPLGGLRDHKVLSQDPLYSTLIDKYNVSAYSLNLAWLLQKGDHIIPIPGVQRLENMNKNFKAASLKLAADDIAFLDSFPNKYEPTAS